MPNIKHSPRSLTHPMTEAFFFRKRNTQIKNEKRKIVLILCALHAPTYLNIKITKCVHNCFYHLIIGNYMIHFAIHTHIKSTKEKKYDLARGVRGGKTYVHHTFWPNLTYILLNCYKFPSTFSQIKTLTQQNYFFLFSSRNRLCIVKIP